MNYILSVSGIVFIIIGSYCFYKLLDLIKVDKSRNNEIIAAFFKIAAISIPIIAVCLTAVIIENSEIVIGTLFGVNMFMFLVVIGRMLLLHEFILSKTEKSCVLSRLSYAIFSTVVVLYLAGDYLRSNKEIQSQITSSEGIVLLLIFIFYMVLQIGNILKLYRNEDVSLKEQIRNILYILRNEIICLKNIIILICGIVSYILGGVLIAIYSYKIAINFGISQNIMSVFFISLVIGASATIILSKRENDLSFNIVNDLYDIISVYSNLLILILGISSVMFSIKITMYNIYDIIFLIVSEFIMWICIKVSKKSLRLSSCLMITLYIAYMVFVIRR